MKIKITESLLKELVAEILEEFEDEEEEIEEVSASGNAGAYMTPAAFVGRGSGDKKRKKDFMTHTNKMIGYEPVWDDDEADPLDEWFKKRGESL